jgi:2'-5' RNA ligase
VGNSIEGVFDSGLEFVVRGDWATLIDAGLPSQGRNPAPSNRPHVTFAYASAYPEDVEARLPESLGDLPLAVRIGAVAAFPAHGRPESEGPWFTLVRMLVPSPGLLDLHARLLELVGDAPGLARNCRVGAWTPHVTLARRITAEQVGTAIGALASSGRRSGGVRGGRGHRSDLTGELAGVRRWDGDTRRTWLVVPGHGAGAEHDRHTGLGHDH